LAARLGFGSQTAGEPSDGAKPIHALTLRCFGDQVPNPNSRVTLGTKRDALGMPRLQLHWQLTEADHRGLRLLAQTLGAELTRTGLARVRIPQWLSTNEPTWSESLQGGHHPMGTTRMSARASDGVVNEDCRVHDIENLFIAGSSVFPTAGHANPTLTLVALAFRLAEHVKTTLSKAGEK
jgi:choline dehydrogenase-like flavoprotein